MSLLDFESFELRWGRAQYERDMQDKAEEAEMREGARTRKKTAAEVKENSFDPTDIDGDYYDSNCNCKGKGKGKDEGKDGITVIHTYVKEDDKGKGEGKGSGARARASQGVMRGGIE